MSIFQIIEDKYIFKCYISMLCGVIKIDQVTCGRQCTRLTNLSNNIFLFAFSHQVKGPSIFTNTQMPTSLQNNISLCWQCNTASQSGALQSRHAGLETCERPRYNQIKVTLSAPRDSGVFPQKVMHYGRMETTVGKTVICFVLFWFSFCFASLFSSLTSIL